MKDKILNSRLLKRIRELKISKKIAADPFFGKLINYETVSYVICGVLTTAVNYVVYFLMPRFESRGFDIVLATCVSWAFAVIFAFAVNKAFVFDSPSWDRKTLLREFVPFLTCRLLSLAFDALFMYVTVGVLRLNEPLFKILSSVFVLLANYFASKFLIFRKKVPDAEQKEVPK